MRFPSPAQFLIEGYIKMNSNEEELVRQINDEFYNFYSIKLIQINYIKLLNDQKKCLSCLSNYDISNELRLLK